MFGVSEICFLYTDAPLGSLEMPSDGPASFRGPECDPHSKIALPNTARFPRLLIFLSAGVSFAIEVGGPNLSD
jgi:hypothetical protein